jgi:hypothetical protein
MSAATKATRPPVAPPKSWFENPHFSAVTPLKVDDDGHVYGHLASWDSCHTASAGLGSACVRAPRSNNDYASFHVGYVTSAEGVDVPVGHVVAGAPHADPVWGLSSTLIHYSHSGWVGADVRAGEDRFGIWIAGAVRPDISPEQLRALKGAPLSGDWRADPKTGQLELVSALAVNSPGFSIARTRPTALIASSGLVRSMWAVGMVNQPAFSREWTLLSLKMRADRIRRGQAGPSMQRVKEFGLARQRQLRAQKLGSFGSRVTRIREMSLVASMSAPQAQTIPWTGTLGAEGLPTGDGRLIDPGALTAADLPLPLRWTPVDYGGHDGAVVVGRIDSVQRAPGGLIQGSGVLDLGSAYGREIARQIAGGYAGGISFDLDDTTDILMFSPVATDDSGESPNVVISAGRIRAATIVAIPAFAEARITLAAPYEPEDSGDCGCNGVIDIVPAPTSSPTTN